MKKTNIALMSIFSLLGLVLFIAACEDNGTTGSNLASFIGGTESLSMDFEKTTPTEVYDNKAFPFPISVKVENKGEYSVPKDKVRVTLDGVDPAEFGKSVSDMTKRPSEDLVATRLDVSTRKTLPGTQTYVEFGDFNYQLNIQGQQDKIIRATMCYDYANLAQAKLCIKENPLDLQKDSICDVKGIKQVAVSSGPIQITSFEQTPSAADKIRFTFVVEHKGDGSIYKETKDCNGRENENKVYLAVDSGDMSSGLSCSGIEGGNSGYVTLFDGAKTIICTQSIGAKKGTFEKIVNIQMRYGYEKIKATKIVVKSND